MAMKKIERQRAGLLIVEALERAGATENEIREIGKNELAIKSFLEKHRRPSKDELLKFSLKQLGFSVRIVKVVQRLLRSGSNSEEAVRLEELINLTARELLACKNFGYTALYITRDRLKVMGFKLKDD